MYVQWLLGVPWNKNFSFERDMNNDGVPDNWTGDSVKCSRYEDYDCPHGLRLNYTSITSDMIYGYGADYLSFKYKFLGSGNQFSVILGGTGYSKIIHYEDLNWHFFEESGVGGNNIHISNGSADIVIEDLVLIPKYQQFTVNPTVFNDDRRIVEEVVDTINNEKFLIKPILFNYSQSIINAVFLYIDRIQLDFLKGLSRKKIIIRMSDDRMLACRVIRVEEEYVEAEQGQCQNYTVRMSFEKI